MPSALPTENTQCKAVNVFGIGMYDSQRDNDGSHGEDSERKEPEGRTLPDDQTRSPQTSDPFEHDRKLSYPDTPDARLGASDLPGDMDGNYQHFHPKTDTYDAVIRSVAECTALPQGDVVDGRDPGAIRKKKVSEECSELPNDADNPVARSDYFDRMSPGHAASRHKAGYSDYIAPDEDCGAYAQEQDNSSIPTVNKNEDTMDDFLQSLGNWWSGKEIEDISSPQGFPTLDFSENADFDKSDQQSGGTVAPFGDSRTLASVGVKMNRQATNIGQVIALTTEFLKIAGKKDLTKRHVLAFLQKQGLPQYLSSDIIRCLKLSHDIHVKDVLDEFPVYREASVSSKTSIASIRDKLINLGCENVSKPEVFSILQRCAANLSCALVDMEKLERLNIR